MRLYSKTNTFVLSLILLWGMGFVSSAQAASAEIINRQASAALAQLHTLQPEILGLTAKASAVLIFPKVRKAAFGIGFTRGEGALFVQGKVQAYYKMSGFNLGLQAGIKNNSQVYLFMTEEALENFMQKNRRNGFEIGVALPNRGANGMIDSYKQNQTVLGFTFNNRGLIAELNINFDQLIKIDKV